jgi:hypothetical protein
LRKEEAAALWKSDSERVNKNKREAKIEVHKL